MLKEVTMEKSFRFIFQDTDALDIPVKMIREFEVGGIPKWRMRISEVGDEMYRPFGVLPPIRKFWSLRNKNLTQLRIPECVIDGVRYLANAIDTYDNDKYDWRNIPQETREIGHDLVIGVGRAVRTG